MEKKYTCCICHKEFTTNQKYWGNNPEPVMPGYDKKTGKNNLCCDDCNINVVIPARMKLLQH